MAELEEMGHRRFDAGDIVDEHRMGVGCPLPLDLHHRHLGGAQHRDARGIDRIGEDHGIDLALDEALDAEALLLAVLVVVEQEGLVAIGERLALHGPRHMGEEGIAGDLDQQMADGQAALGPQTARHDIRAVADRLHRRLDALARLLADIAARRQDARHRGLRDPGFAGDIHERGGAQFHHQPV